MQRPGRGVCVPTTNTFPSFKTENEQKTTRTKDIMGTTQCHKHGVRVQDRPRMCAEHHRRCSRGGKGVVRGMERGWGWSLVKSG